MVAVLLLMQDLHLGNIDNVFAVTTYQVAIGETLFHGLQPAAQHILFDAAGVVLVPDLDVVVVRFYVINVFQPDAEFHRPLIVGKSDDLLIRSRRQLIAHNIPQIGKTHCISASMHFQKQCQHHA